MIITFSPEYVRHPSHLPLCEVVMETTDGAPYTIASVRAALVGM
jgi:hypothetical protein